MSPDSALAGYTKGRRKRPAPSQVNKTCKIRLGPPRRTPSSMRASTEQPDTCKVTEHCTVARRPGLLTKMVLTETCFGRLPDLKPTV